MVDPIKIVDALDQIEERLHAGDFAAAADYLRSLHPADGAEILLSLNPEQRAKLIELLSADELALVFAQMDGDEAADVVEHLDIQAVAEVLDEMEADVAADLLAELEPAEATAVLEQMDEAETVAPLLAYPEDTAGGIMNVAPPSLRRFMTVAEAFQFIKQNYHDAEEVFYLYVLDRNSRLLGVLNLRALILAELDQRIEDIMNPNVISVRVDMDQEEVAQLFSRYDLLALPVVDAEDRLVGIVTVDDVVDVTEEEATEDFHKFGSIQNAVFNPLEATITFLYRKRIVWLIALVFMNVFSGAAIAAFEETIAASVALVFFLPLLIDSSGNAGSQSATLMVRALATGDVKASDWFRLLGKELSVALLLGITMAAGVAAVASFRAPEIILVVALTMVCVVLVGSLVGLTLPFIFTRLGLDPATASAPLITSIADISGVLIYFSLATWLLGSGG
mgnify:CR=1 FL=1